MKFPVEILSGNIFLFRVIDLYLQYKTKHMYVLKTEHAEYNVFLKRKKYSNGRTAIELIDAEDGCPVMMATVNIPDAHLEKDEVIIKNYSENEGVLDFLIANGITSKPDRWIASGWVTCPVVKLLNNS